MNFLSGVNDDDDGDADYCEQLQLWHTKYRGQIGRISRGSQKRKHQ